MDLLHNIATGFGVAFQWHNLLFCFVGCVIGTLIGVLPGIYYGAQYGVLFPLILFIALIGAVLPSARRTRSIFVAHSDD